jgi:hypothetical protein
MGYPRLGRTRVVELRARLVAKEEHDVYNDTTQQCGRKYGRTDVGNQPVQSKVRGGERAFGLIGVQRDGTLATSCPFHPHETRRSAETTMSQVDH